MAKTIEKKKTWFGVLHSKIAGVVKKNAARTPKLKSVRKVGSTPKSRSAAKGRIGNSKRKRSSIGISSLSRSKISTPKTAKKKKANSAVKKYTDSCSEFIPTTSKAIEVQPLMPRVLYHKEKDSSSSNPPIIVLDDTDEGIVVDKSTKSTLPTSPEVEILTVKITPNGSKKVKGPSKAKSNNPQKIFSKFNLPNPVFPKDENFIPVSDKQEKSKRHTRNSAGYRFDPKAKANTNFTPLSDHMPGKVYTFQGSAASTGSYGGNRRPTMGLNQLHASSRSKMQPSATSQSNVAPAFHNVHAPDIKSPEKEGALRTIVIDGQNVAVEHAKANGGLVIYNQGSSSGGAAPRFSCEGIKLCVDYFKKRGHKDVIAFVPQFRQKRSQSDKPEILERLNQEGILKFTPCKQIDGKSFNSYDDRFIVQCAALKNGVIVSNDNYRDLALEDSKLKNVIDNHVLKFVWIGNTLMFSQDPLGKNGPSLEEFLQH